MSNLLTPIIISYGHSDIQTVSENMIDSNHGSNLGEGSKIPWPLGLRAKIDSIVACNLFSMLVSYKNETLKNSF